MRAILIDVAIGRSNASTPSRTRLHTASSSLQTTVMPHWGRVSAAPTIRITVALADHARIRESSGRHRSSVHLAAIIRRAIGVWIIRASQATRS
jgi:hypothetical protein